jgi:hypothetical protein
MSDVVQHRIMRGAGLCGRDVISNSVLVGTRTDELAIFQANIHPKKSQATEEALTGP